MRFGSVGGVIAAAGKEEAAPLLRLGAIPAVKRVVLTFQQAGIFPIVVVTGKDEVEVRHQLAPMGVIFLYNEAYERPRMWDSVKLGLGYLKGKCDKVVFTPVNVPLFTPETLRRLLAAEAPIVTPVYGDRGGHPVVLRGDILDEILSFSGQGGLRGALAQQEPHRCRVPVEDPGVGITVHEKAQLLDFLGERNRDLVAPCARVSIEKDTVLLDTRLKLLLYLIGDLGSVRQACAYSGLSYGKAWEMINRLEREVGCTVVERRHGGKNGGSTLLTERGKALMEAFQAFETAVSDFSREKFQELFQKSGLI